VTRTIGILGGGTAGYLAALGLKKHVPGVQVEVIAAPDIPPIGVGESTTPQIVWFLHHYLGLDARDFYQKVRPTWKLGVQLAWGLPGDYWFNFPFDIIEAADEAPGFDIRRASLLATLMDLDRSPVLGPNGGAGHTAVKKNSYAYHLDNRLPILGPRFTSIHCGKPACSAPTGST
jgi:tryptophan halogenase